jgi:7-cyano-7-deazaguanine synthase
MKRKTIGVLMSGGLDSAALAGYLSERYRKVYPIYIQQGLRWERIERYWLKKFLAVARRRAKVIQPLTVLSLPMADVYGAHWSLGRGIVPGAKTKDAAVYLPGRNLLLSLKAAVFCTQRRVPLLAIGSLGHNPFPDATPRFFVLWSRALSLGLGEPMTIVAPFRHLSKTAVIRAAKAWPLILSFSCLAPQGIKHCGRCNKCAERQMAFRQAEVEDRTPYAA